jgi:hypothetical protein
VLGLPEGTYLAKRWNPTREVYETVDTLQPGIGFWLYLPNEGTNITMSNLTFPQSVFTQSTPIRLSRGWNQIGNPYPYPLILGQIVVVSASDPRNSHHLLSRQPNAASFGASSIIGMSSQVSISSPPIPTRR